MTNEKYISQFLQFYVVIVALNIEHVKLKQNTTQFHCCAQILV